jgi:hypothetical protein
LFHSAQAAQAVEVADGSAAAQKPIKPIPTTAAGGCKVGFQIQGRKSSRPATLSSNLVKNRRRNRSLSRRQCRGVAATELAVCMPVIVLIVLATMEACAMMFLQQSLSVAAYEGARVGLAPGATAGDVVQQCRQILDDREVRGATVSVTPSNLPAATEGTWISVEATAPFSQNSLAGGWLFNASRLTADVQMMKER